MSCRLKVISRHCREVSLLESEELLIAAELRLMVMTCPAMDGHWSAAPPSR